jgi:hypothetical protein
MTADPIPAQSRRFSSWRLRLVWIVAAIFCGAAWWIGSPVISSRSQNAIPGPTTDKRTPAPAELDELQKIARAYNIEILTADPGFPVTTVHGVIDGRIATIPDLQNYVSLFVPEFTLYPPELLRRSRLARVTLCRDLSFAGQLRNAIPDYEHDTLYLDVNRGANNKMYLRKVIHHEFFHVIDYRDDGNVYSDDRWAALNPVNVRYGSGGRAAQTDSDTSVLTDKYPGFLNHYGTTGVEEDKAEMFANLIVDLEYVETRAMSDAIIAAKVKCMKELLVRFCPEMNDEFWERVRGFERRGK